MCNKTISYSLIIVTQVRNFDLQYTDYCGGIFEADTGKSYVMMKSQYRVEAELT